jgi:hypothetical protein
MKNDGLYVRQVLDLPSNLFTQYELGFIHAKHLQIRKMLTRELITRLAKMRVRSGKQKEKYEWVRGLIDGSKESDEYQHVIDEINHIADKPRWQNKSIYR